MSKHTPGPWTDDDDGWIGGPNGVEVCCYAGCGSHEAEWSNPADKTLAIAAPELLEVAKRCEALLLQYDLDAVNGDSLATEHFGLIRKAIAKATGEVA